MGNRSWQDILREPASERHLVQVYRDRDFLVDAVVAWVAPALARGGGAVLICAPEHAALVRARLGDTTRLVVADAEETLRAFMVDGSPDRARFQRALAPLLAQVRAKGATEIRAWGEMVNLLWHRGEREAAQKLEALWNLAIDEQGIRLLCSYELDNLAPETHEGSLRAACAGHSHLIPESDHDAFEAAFFRALVEEMGEREAALARADLAKRRTIPIDMPASQAVLVALHESQPDVATRVLARTRSYL